MPTDESLLWYYMAGNERFGPFTAKQFAKEVLAGKVQPDTLVWHDGASDWMRFIESPFLKAIEKGQAALKPPPLPKIGRPAATKSMQGALTDGAWWRRAIDITEWFSVSGRLSRREYLIRGAGLAAIAIGMRLLDLVAFGHLALFSFLWRLVAIVPGTTYTVRRLHDRGWSGWRQLWIFFPVAGFIYLAIETLIMKGRPGPNRFGPDPLATAKATCARSFKPIFVTINKQKARIAYGLVGFACVIRVVASLTGIYGDTAEASTSNYTRYNGGGSSQTYGGDVDTVSTPRRLHAVFSCRLQDLAYTVSACFMGDSSEAPGALRISNNGAARVYTPYDIAEQFQRTQVMMPLGQRFEIRARASSRDFVVLHIDVKDERGRVVATDEASAMGSILMSSDDMR